MKPKLKRLVHDGQLVGYDFYCPGCSFLHVFYVTGPKTWHFNGDMEKPTFSPSLLLFTPESVDPITGEKIPRRTVCHLILTNGVINFCGDSAHKLAGQAVPMVDWPDPSADVGGGE